MSANVSVVSPSKEDLIKWTDKQVHNKVIVLSRSVQDLQLSVKHLELEIQTLLRGDSDASLLSPTKASHIRVEIKKMEKWSNKVQASLQEARDLEWTVRRVESAFQSMKEDTLRERLKGTLSLVASSLKTSGSELEKLRVQLEVQQTAQLSSLPQKEQLEKSEKFEKVHGQLVKKCTKLHDQLSGFQNSAAFNAWLEEENAHLITHHFNQLSMRDGTAPVEATPAASEESTPTQPLKIVLHRFFQSAMDFRGKLIQRGILRESEESTDEKKTLTVPSK